MQTRTTQLEQVIEAYFAACDATRERFPLKSGGFSERQIPCRISNQKPHNVSVCAAFNVL